MKKLTTLTLLLLGASYCFGQDIPKFGKIPDSAVLKEFSVIDSTADAEVLFDYGTVRFTYDELLGICILTDIHRAVKIYKKSALSRGSLGLVYYGNSSRETERINQFQGYTYNVVNGNVEYEKLDRKTIVRESKSDGVYMNKVSFPNVKEGSVIEYSFQRVTPFSIMNKPRTWFFQEDIPVVQSVYEISIPNYFYYQMIFGGYLELASSNQEPVPIDMGYTPLNTNGLKYTLEVRNAPAFKDEKFITTENDYLSKIEFDLSSVTIPNQVPRHFNESWESLDETLMNSTSWGGHLRGSKLIRNEVEPFLSIESLEERTVAILNHITSKYEWNEYNSLWAPTSTKKVIDEKKGNSSELNLLLCAMLKEAGISADPVILSTRANGRINEVYPLLDRFNYTIVGITKADSKITFMDATYPMSLPGMLPQKCLVERARMIGENGGRFVDIAAQDLWGEMSTVDVKLDVEEGVMNGELKSSFSGIYGHQVRVLFKKAGEEKVLEEIQESMEDWSLEAPKLEGMENVSKSVSFIASFEKEDEGLFSEMLYVPSILFGQIEENPFKNKERKYPVDFGHRTTNIYQGKLHIPEGYVVESLPEPMSIRLPGKLGNYIFSATQKDNEIQVVSRLVLRKSRYSSAEYPYLRELYAKVVDKQAEQIVLRAE